MSTVTKDKDTKRKEFEEYQKRKQIENTERQKKKDAALKAFEEYQSNRYKSEMVGWQKKAHTLIDSLYNDSQKRGESYQDSLTFSQYYNDNDAKIAELLKEGEQYGNYFGKQGDKYNDYNEAYKEAVKYLQGWQSSLAAENAHWSKWTSEEEYNADVAAAEEWEKTKAKYDAYDADAGAAKIERLRYYLDREKELKAILAGTAMGNTPYEINAAQGQKNAAAMELQNLYAEYAKEFGGNKPNTIHGDTASNSLLDNMSAKPVASSPVNFEGLLNEAEAYDTLAKRYQNKAELEKAPQMSDFTAGVAYGKAVAPIDINTVKFDIAQGHGGATVSSYFPKGLEAARVALQLRENDFTADNYDTAEAREFLFGDKAQTNTGFDDTFVKKYLVGMTEEQFDNLAYYLYVDSKNGTHKAEEYIDAIADDVNREKGNYDFESSALKDSTILQKLYALPAGLDTFATGIRNLGNDEYVPTSPVQYTSSRVSGALADNGLKYYNANTGKFETVKIMGKSTSQLFYEANTSVANMAPALATSAAVELLLPTVGEGAGVFAGFLVKQIPKLASGAVLGASAAGHAKNEMLELGYSKEVANNYGLLVGASEAGLEMLLGSIPGLSDGGVFSKLGEVAIGKLDNVLGKAAYTLAKYGITWTASGADEALEEGLQTCLESWFKEVVTKVDFESPDAEEVAYSMLLGYLTGAGFSVGGDAVHAVQSLPKAVSTTIDRFASGSEIKSKGQAGAYVQKGLSLEGTRAYDIASKIQNRTDNGKRISNYSLGKLAQSFSDSQMSADFQTKIGDRAISESLTDIVKGRDVRNSDLKKVIGNEAALSLLNETLGTDIKAENSLDEARDIISKAFESSEGKTPAETKIDRNRVVKSLEVNLPLEKAESFATIIADIGNGNEVSDKQIASVLNNKYARNALNKYLGRTADNKFTESSKASDVRAAMAEGDYSRQGQAVLFGSTLGMSGNAIKGLSAVVANSHADVASIARAYNVVYKAAKSGKALADVSGVEALSPTQKLIAYEYGVMDGLTSKTETKVDEVVDNAVDEEVTESAKEVTEEPTTEAEISRESEVEEGAIVTKGGETIVPVKENTKEQTRIIDMGKKLGVEVAFGKITKNGKNIDGLFDGKVLYINPKTTSGNAAYILFKHEFTHFLEKSTKYINFAKEVTQSKAFSEWLKKKGFKNSAEYYAQIIADYKQIGKNLEKGGAQKEAVANFCAEMLYAKDDSMQRFVDTLSADHKRTFGELIRDFIEWIKKKLGKVDEIAMLEKKYADVFQSKRFDAKSFVAETKDTQANFVYAEQHKQKLSEKYSSSAAVDLTTLEQRYDKILEIWERLGGQLDSKFLNEWNSKVGKDRAFTVFKAQSGYKYNVELSSMCKKGVPLFEAIDTIVKEEAMKELKVNKLGKAEKEILYDLLKSDGFDIPCAICYVEQARQREGDIINAFLNGNDEGKAGWNQVLHEVEAKMANAGVDYKFPALDRSVATDKYVPATVKMTEGEQNAFYEALKDIANREITKYNELHKKDKKFNPRKLVTSLTPTAINDVFKGNISSAIKIFKVLFQNPDSRFTIESDLLYASTTTHNLAYSHNALYSLFNQQGGVSGYKTKQGNVVYWGDILDKKWEASKLRKEGGIRYQSNSDSQMYTLLDQVQMFIDLTAKGYYLQSYSKVLSYLKLLGLSKGKINASLIPKVVVYRDADGNVDWVRTQENAGLDENGNPIYDDIEGINHEEAFMLIKDADYSKSVGGVCIGYSDNHIRTLLDDSRIQLIIGFHDKTNNPDKRYRGARYAKNYNGINEAVDSEGKTVHIGFNQYVRQAEGMFTKVGEGFEGTTTHNGKTYDANDIPRLAADLYLEMCAKKGYAPAYNIEGIVDHKNYYKLLADFSLYDSKGNYAPHQKVEYNMPDQVPYLDENGHKRYMSTERYIRNELQKELKVRDDIAEKLADKSEDGLIPRFIKAVNGENDIQADNGTPGNNQDGVSEDIGNDDGTGDLTSYSYTPDKEATVDELVSQFEDGRITREELVNAFSKMKQKPDAAPPPVERKTGENNVDGERDTIIARGASKLFSEEFKEEAKADEFIMRYKTIKNKDALRKAAQELDANGQQGVLDWFKTPVERGVSLTDVTKGYILLERYKQAGDLEGQVAVAQKLSDMGTMGGQVVQSFTILSRFTPEGMLLFAQRTMDAVLKRMIVTQSDAWLQKHAEDLKLTDEDIEFIYNRMILAEHMPDGRDKQVMLAEIAARIQHKIPPAKGQSIKSLQRISMLLNPKTIIRNVLGNATITSVHWLSDLIHAPVDMALSKISHKRVKGLRSDVKASMEASWNGMKYALEDWLKDINTQENLDRFEINKNGGRSFYEGGKLSGAAKALNAMDRLTSFTLAVGDRPFYKYWFSRSLTSQMAANKVATPTAEMIEIATQEALERTWQDDNNVTAMVSRMKDALNTISIVGYGLGDVFIKFTKTPANLAKAIYDFSPVGFSTAARDAWRFSKAVKSGKDVAKAQRNFGKSFSNAAAGTLLYVMAYALFKAGRLTGGADEDKDVAAFEKWVQGIPAYSFNLFGKWFSYEWMQPIGSVAAIVSDYMDAKDAEGDDKLQPIITALKSGGAVLYNQSFLKSFQTLFTADNIVDGFFEALLDDPSAFVPQIFSQIANVADKNRRTTFDKTSPIKSAINAIAYKIPGLRNTLTEDVDVFGRVVPNSQSKVGNAFFNPANTYVNTSDEVTNHVYGLYKALGNRNMIPAKAGYSIDINGTKYILNPEERAEYQTIMGSVSYKIIEGLLEDDFYNSYSPSEQEVVIKNVYAYANAVARANFNAKMSYELLKNYNAFLTRSKYDAMTEEEKREAYRNGILKEYADILDTDENGVVAYFVNKGTKTAIQNALYANNVEAAILALERGKENVGKYSDNEDDVKSYTSNMRAGVTNAMKEEYILAYYEGDEQRMAEIKQMLTDIGLYENVNKTLKEWRESVTK